MPSMTTTPKIVIFSDLDGTLLDRESYSFKPALPALRVTKQKGIPLVLSSSKTRAEIELYRKKMENEPPFISENGGGVFVPKGYFLFQDPYDRELDEYFVLELGTYYPGIIEVLESIKNETGIKIKGFSDLTEKELVSLSGLSLEEAAFAKRREYDEPFIVEGGGREIEIIKRKIEEKEMNYVWGGRFHHILGKNDKGKAVEILKELYENESFSITTVGVGDSLNDLLMMLSVDHPVFLKGREDHTLKIPLKIQNLTTVEETGPQAWNEVVLSLLSKLKL